MFNLPNKITLARIALIPIFMIIMLAPFDWGRLEVGDESIGRTFGGGHSIYYCIYNRLGGRVLCPKIESRNKLREIS